MGKFVKENGEQFEDTAEIEGIAWKLKYFRVEEKLRLLSVFLLDECAQTVEIKSDL